MYAPLQKISKQKSKFGNKAWITLGLQKSISIKNHLLTKYIKLKDVTLKKEVQIKYKQYRNLLSTLMEEGKKSYFTYYFQNNLNYLKNAWKGIKNLISLKELANVASPNIFDNGRSLTGPPQINVNYFFLNPIDEIEVKNIIMSLSLSKAVGPNSIPIKIFKLLMNDVSSQLTELFNLSFFSGVSPLILKTSF